MASLRFEPDTSLHGHAVIEYPVSLCLTVTLLFKPDTLPHRHTVTEYPSPNLRSEGLTSTRARYVT